MSEDIDFDMMSTITENEAVASAVMLTARYHRKEGFREGWEAATATRPWGTTVLAVTCFAIGAIMAYNIILLLGT